METTDSILVPPHISELTAYEPGKTIAEVREAYNPDRISKLASNENRLGCSSKVGAAVEKALDEIQDYPDPIARELRADIAKRNDVSEEQVILAAGSESLIANLCRTFFKENEEAITAEATFVGFYVQANIENVTFHSIPLTEDYRFDLQAIADAITEQTKLIYIANPNNPTGTYVTKGEFEVFMQQVPKRVLVVMDEAYYEYACSIEDYPRSLEYSYDNVLTLRTFSKGYGLAGFRIGYGIGPSDVIEMMLKTKLTFEPTTMAQAAARAAYRDTEFLERSREMVEQGKQQLYTLFDEYNVDYVPSAANSVMMILPNACLAQKFNQAMLRKGVILRRTGAFGLPHCIRITIGTGAEMDHFEESFKNVYHNILPREKV